MYKVIIADDEPKVSQLIKNLIDWEALNLEHAATAHDGYEALALIKKHNPDIVITDVRMPGYDGIELIKNAKEFNQNIDFILVSGYQHFDYAYNAIKYGVKDYFLKPLKKNEINATLSKMVSKYSDKTKQELNNLESLKRHRLELLENIYHASDTDSFKLKTIHQINDSYNLSLKEGCHQAIIIKPDFEYQHEYKEAMRILLDKILKIAEKNLDNVCYEFVSASFGDNIFIVVNFKEDNKKQLRKALNNILDESNLFKDVFKDLIVTIGTGNIYSRFDLLEQSAIQAKEAIIDRVVLGCGKINSYNQDMHPNDYQASLIALETRKKLLDCIDIFDLEGVKSIIDGIEENIKKTPIISGCRVYGTVHEIMDTVVYGLKNQLSISSEKSNIINEFFMIADMQNNVRDLFNSLRKYVIRIMMEIQKDMKAEASRPIKKAQNYINMNYAHDINLEKMSEMAGFNATYFSVLFKKEIGIGFVEYLINIRIKVAKRLLADTNKSILDICLEVGYNDIKHFTKQFKKITKLTPSEYRKLHHRG